MIYATGVPRRWAFPFPGERGYIYSRPTLPFLPPGVPLVPNVYDHTGSAATVRWVVPPIPSPCPLGPCYVPTQAVGGLGMLGVPGVPPHVVAAANGLGGLAGDLDCTRRDLTGADLAARAQVMAAVSRYNVIAANPSGVAASKFTAALADLRAAHVQCRWTPNELAAERWLQEQIVAASPDPNAANAPGAPPPSGDTAPDAAPGFPSLSRSTPMPGWFWPAVAAAGALAVGAIVLIGRKAKQPNRRRRNHATSEPMFEVDVGEGPFRASQSEMLASNQEDDEVREAILTMRPGETRHFGGGAWATSTLTRVSNRRRRRHRRSR